MIRVKSTIANLWAYENDVTTYMRYYNLEWLHTANGSLSPVEYEQNSLEKLPWINFAEH